MKTQLKKALDELRRTLPSKLSDGGETTGEGAINIGLMNRVRAAFAIAIGKYHTIEATTPSLLLEYNVICYLLTLIIPLLQCGNIYAATVRTESYEFNFYHARYTPPKTSLHFYVYCARIVIGNE